MIGADATGLPFNSIMAILLENDHPPTPLVNSGAIAAFAPPLDGSGNSVKAQLAIEYIMNKLNLNVFSGTQVSIVQK